MDPEELRQVLALGAEGSPVHLRGIPLHKMDLRKLRHVAVLAFEGNFSRAAEKLHITTSALSQSISSLEEALGVELFTRGNGGVALSSVGRQFIGRIDRLLFDARGLARDLALASKAAGGDIVFGVRPAPARIFLSQLVEEMLPDYPGLRIKVGTTINETLIEYLLLEGFEFVICDAPVTRIDDRLITRHLASVSMGFFVGADHPLALRGSCSLADLRRFPIASANLTEDNLRSVRRWIGLSADDEFPGTFWCDDYGYLLDIVRNGNALLLAPAQAVEKETGAGELTELFPEDASAACSCDIYLITLADRNYSPAMEVIVERISGILRDKGIAR